MGGIKGKENNGISLFGGLRWQFARVFVVGYFELLLNSTNNLVSKNQGPRGEVKFGVWGRTKAQVLELPL